MSQITSHEMHIANLIHRRNYLEEKYNRWIKLKSRGFQNKAAAVKKEIDALSLEIRAEIRKERESK